MRTIRRAAVLGLTAATVSVVATAAILRFDQPASREQRLASFKQQLLAQYDLADARFDTTDLVAPGVARDGIPALTNPSRTLIPADNDRLVVVQIDGETVAYPLNILNWHEIINDEVAATPIAVTYCPLCDSVAVFDRRLRQDDGSTRILEFGVSGLLHNSNVLMYERSTMGLWSQVAMQCLSGPDAGRTLDQLPFRMMTFARLRTEHPDAEIISTDTGHDRPYRANPYASYLKDPNAIFHDFDYDDRLPPKTLGLGIAVADEAWFVPAERAADAPITIDTPAGPVRVHAGPAGIEVLQAPQGARIVQSFWHSFSAFYPKTRIVPDTP